MKKRLGFAAAILASLAGFSASAQTDCCGVVETNCYQPVKNGTETTWLCDTTATDCNQQAYECCNLPKSAQCFINNYYCGEQIANVKYDKKKSKKGEYKVRFANGEEVTFEKSGEWKEIEAPYGDCIPDGIAPDFINKYLVNNFPQSGINELEREGKGYEVGLTSGEGLQFSSNGEFVAVD